MEGPKYSWLNFIEFKNGWLKTRLLSLSSVTTIRYFVLSHSIATSTPLHQPKKGGYIRYMKLSLAWVLISQLNWYLLYLLIYLLHQNAPPPSPSVSPHFRWSLWGPQSSQTRFQFAALTGTSSAASWLFPGLEVAPWLRRSCSTRWARYSPSHKFSVPISFLKWLLNSLKMI